MLESLIIKKEYVAAQEFWISSGRNTLSYNLKGEKLKVRDTKYKV